MGIIPTTTFQSHFLLPTFYMDTEGDILGYCCSISPNKSRKWYWATERSLFGFGNWVTT
jgi:hypothetical protein